MTEAEFRRAVDQALAGLPEHLAAALDNVAVLVADRNDEAPDIYGLYTGTPLTERTGEGYAGSLPDAIEIYRLPLEADFGHDHDLLVHEIRVTVLHELGHHFGIGEDELEELGWS